MEWTLRSSRRSLTLDMSMCDVRGLLASERKYFICTFPWLLCVARNGVVFHFLFLLYSLSMKDSRHVAGIFYTGWKPNVDGVMDIHLWVRFELYVCYVCSSLWTGLDPRLPELTYQRKLYSISDCKYWWNIGPCVTRFPLEINKRAVEQCV